MKLFAPKNTVSWDVRDPNSGWASLGGMRTVSGKRVTEDSAMEYAPVMAATRVISEAVASLPLSILEQVDYRTTRKATDHSLWRVLHDVPNPEQDKMCWFDMQVAFQCNRGNAYAEIQRDGDGIIALWPIHPSRIPTCNITRNPLEPYDWHRIVVGQPGEIVYWVRNDDGTLTPIPASDMLHVPGILSTNGITGQSIVRYAANAIGIGIATEEHAGAFFKNGAAYNLALVSDKVVGKDTAERLRASWQQTYAGSHNSYKTLILEEGMKPMPLNTEPEKSQLTLSRQFSIGEIARFWKLPPHMLGDLSQATFSNIEQQYLEFVIHSLGPWVVRWECAMYRQLLTPEEQKRYRFKFNLNAMLRGDSAARSAFYTSLFQMGVVSPNDIRELEDWNPVEGGDERFIPANNLFPLTKATEMAQAQIDKLKAPPPEPKKALPAPAPTDLTRDLLRLELRDATDEWRREVLKLEEQRVQNAEKALEAIEKTASGIETVAEKVDALEQTVRTESDANNEMNVRLHAAAAERDKTSGEKLDALPAALAGAVVPAVERMAKASEALPATLSEAQKPIIEAIQAIPQPVAVDLTPVLEKFDQIPTSPPVVAPVIDTSAAEALAVREAALAAQQADDAARLATERETTDRVLTLAIKRAIDNLAAWEAKALTKTADKPLEWKSWRETFYSRFRKQFEASLADFSAEFERCGLILDLTWAADRYANRSITDLKTLDQHAADNWSDRLRETVDHFLKRDWTDRAQNLAIETMERGKRLFNERKDKEKCHN